jgi:hypothetical protein
MNRILILGIILLGILTRLVPHPPNFTPILSFALLSSVYTKNNLGIFIPISIMLLSDMFIGSHGTIIWVYSSLFVIYLIGYYFIQNITFKNILIGSFVGSLAFFIITNLGVWFIGYPKTLEGLIQCYVMALPFYKNTLLSSVLYSSLIHAVYVFVPSKLIALDSK